jgi:hypothetical protein
MTVKELIEKLSELDPNLHVFTDGYEGGYNDVEISKINSFCLNVHDEWYYGTHEISSLIGEDERSDYKIVKGITL